MSQSITLTEEQRQMFSKLVDLNWEADFNESYTVRDACRMEYYRVKKELMESMGTENFLRYMALGQKMFS